MHIKGSLIKNGNAESLTINEVFDFPQRTIILYLFNQLPDAIAVKGIETLISDNVHFRDRVNSYRYFIIENRVSSIDEYYNAIDNIMDRVFVKLIDKISV